MYTDEDLNIAVSKGIFSADSVAAFRENISTSKYTHGVDEENFSLVSSFNDIFVVIACTLLLGSSAWVTSAIHPSVGMAVLAGLSWILAEFFVRKRKMALPAIMLLLSFIGSIFTTGIFLFKAMGTEAFFFSATAAAIAAYTHWLRFKVPITIAAGTAASVAVVVAALLTMFPGMSDRIMHMVFVGGVVSFSVAMYWDMTDRSRTTRQSDIAFWLHLLAAPMIVHPIFSRLGIADGNENLSNITIILLLYLAMTLISVIIDRRAFMISSLIYVIYAFSEFFTLYGFAGYNLALTGVCIGLALILLSGFWHRVRTAIVLRLPHFAQQLIPPIK